MSESPRIRKMFPHQKKLLEMDYNFNKEITCPYNPAHVVLQGRLQGHLVKCRQQYQQTTASPLDYATCSFNTTHVVPSKEIDLHESMCVDRRSIAELETVQETLLAPAPNHSLAIRVTDTQENWDDVVTDRPVLEMVQEKAKTKPVLLMRHGVKPAERKKHRAEETIRHRQLNENK